jgi:hypothetical protein
VNAKYSLEALRTLRAAREEAFARELSERLRDEGTRIAEAKARLERERSSAALGMAHAEREAVERHRQGWTLERARQADEAEDEAVLERWNAAHLASGRR